MKDDELQSILNYLTTIHEVTRSRLILSTSTLSTFVSIGREFARRLANAYFVDVRTPVIDGASFRREARRQDSL